MKNVKAVLVIVLLAFMVLGFGCSKKQETTEAAGEMSWAETVGVYDNQPTEELYEKAKEEGKVVIYSMSSRLNKVKETFEKQYPGVEVEVYDMRIAEILEKYQREYAADIHTADVLFIKDADGSVKKEFVNMGILHEYLPEDLVATADAAFQSGPYAPYFEMKQIFYNDEVYDKCPIDNWWDLTRPEYKGKIMMANPLQTASIMGIFIAMTRYPGEMEEAYKKEFGKDLVLDGTENAGYEFIKRLAANDLILTTSDGDIVKAVGAPGQTDPPFGLATSSKMRKAGEKLRINVAESLIPRMGTFDPALLYVADKAEHPYAAKLLIRWIGGESEGTGPGFAPFHVRGSWPSRGDVPPIQTQAFETLNLWPVDTDYNYQNMDNMRNYWLSLQ